MDAVTDELDKVREQLLVTYNALNSKEIAEAQKIRGITDEALASLKQKAYNTDLPPGQEPVTENLANAIADAKTLAGNTQPAYTVATTPPGEQYLQQFIDQSNNQLNIGNSDPIDYRQQERSMGIGKQAIKPPGMRPAYAG
jgi:hypothetical protein